jgi:hypothetical protein
VALPLFAVAGVLLVQEAAIAERLAISVLVFTVEMGVSILVIFAFDARAGVSVPVPPVAMVGAIVAIAAALVGGVWHRNRGHRTGPLRSASVPLGS